MFVRNQLMAIGGSHAPPSPLNFHSLQQCLSTMYVQLRKWRVEICKRNRPRPPKNERSARAVFVVHVIRRNTSDTGHSAQFSPGLLVSRSNLSFCAASFPRRIRMAEGTSDASPLVPSLCLPFAEEWRCCCRHPRYLLLSPSVAPSQAPSR